MVSPSRLARPRTAVLDVLRGALMGAAEVLPGVSGGTVALLVGVYERLIRSIRYAASAVVRLARLDLSGTRRQLHGIDWALLLPLAGGMAAAVAGGVAVLPDLLERFPEQGRALFFGFILAALPLPWRQIRQRRRPAVVALALGGALVAFVVTGLPPAEMTDPPAPVVAAAAAVAVCALVLPGVSGSYLLVVMGLYRGTLDAVRALDLAFIAVFALGAAVGLGLFTRVLDWLLARRRDLTMGLLVGLMVGSLRALWPWLDEDRVLAAPPADASTVVVVLVGLLGFGLVSVVVALAHRRAGSDLRGRGSQSPPRLS